MDKETKIREWRWWDDQARLEKLTHAFAIGCSDEEACSYAEITTDQLYYYTRQIEPSFQVKKEVLKQRPILKAKQTIVDSLDKPEHAKWYLERRCKNEFDPKASVADSEGVIVNVISYQNGQADKKLTSDG